jgi:TonB family protein
MTSNIQAPRDPNTAAIFSLLPGLGQLYNGETRKGLLFFVVSLINVFIFILIITNRFVVAGLVGFGLAFGMRPDPDLISALTELQFGSTVSFIIIGLFLIFTAYAIRDAYDHALSIQRKHIYPEYALAMPEATSGSYALHFAALLVFFILAIFFLKQSHPATQITDIEFIQNQPPTKKKIESQRRAEHASENAGHHENKPVEAPSPAPKAPSHPAPHVAPQPVARPVPVPMPHPTPRPTPAHPTAVPRPAPMPTPSANPMPIPLPFMHPSASPSPSPSPIPSPTASHSRGSFAPAPAPTAGTGPIIAGAPGPAPIVTSSGNGGGSTAPVPVPAGGGGNSGKAGGGAPSAAPAPSRGGSRGGGSGPALITPSVPRSAGGGGGEGIRGNPDANNNPDRGPSVAAQADIDFGPYMADLQRRIKRAWFPPKGNESKRVVVVFKIHREGQLSNLRLEHSSGVAVADQAALKAVENAAPFRQLPPGAPDDVDIQFTFDYNVFSGGGSGLFRKF